MKMQKTLLVKLLHLCLSSMKFRQLEPPRLHTAESSSLTVTVGNMQPLNLSCSVLMSELFLMDFIKDG